MKELSEYGLVPHADRAARVNEIRQKTLSFLYYEPYTIAPVIQQLLGYKSNVGTWKLLTKMEKNGLVKRHSLIDFGGRRLLIWGITGAGCAAIYDEDKMRHLRTKGFDTSRIYLSTINHLIELQKVKTRIINSEMSIDILDINPRLWDKKKPDSLIRVTTERGEEVIALEIELTIKSVIRYKSIIREYNKYLSSKLCTTVIWATQTEKQRDNLTRIFENLDTKDNHQFLTIEEMKL
jgi:hypothetical protein